MKKQEEPYGQVNKANLIRDMGRFNGHAVCVYKVCGMMGAWLAGWGENEGGAQRNTPFPLIEMFVSCLAVGGPESGIAICRAPYCFDWRAFK